ncbi:hypothetical protein BC828DRAFT_380511 [Blastocladiella britannica]|nr:hypothetical protein BC828DRAFT_380511 [Blastocladiella britannica]
MTLPDTEAPATAAPIYVFDMAALETALANEGIKAHKHSENVLRHLVTAHGHPAAGPISADLHEVDWSLVPNLPKKAVTLLRERAALATNVAEVSTSSDSNTSKLLVRIRRSGTLVETVIMHYDRRDTHDPLQEPGPVATVLGAADDENDDTVSIASASTAAAAAASAARRNLKPRTAVCISSQVGCKMACTFCATGTMGFKAHLSPAEIAEQIFHANRVRKVNSVIAMGMGEPFDNYDNVVAAIHVMTNRRVFALGEGSICVSTVGVVPKIKQFMIDCPGVKLALSLHAPNQELRNTIVPSAKVYRLDMLLDAVDQYLTLNKRIMIEYILIRNINISPALAHELGELLKDRSVILNLIPYNPTDTGETFEAPLPEEVEEFNRILVTDYSVRTTVRRTMGQDIDGACGQLVVKATRANKSGDLEDLAGNDAVLSSSISGEPAAKRGRVIRRNAATSDASADRDRSPSPEAADPWRSLLPRFAAGVAGVLVARLVWKVMLRRA